MADVCDCPASVVTGWVVACVSFEAKTSDVAVDSRIVATDRASLARASTGDALSMAMRLDTVNMIGSLQRQRGRAGHGFV